MSSLFAQMGSIEAIKGEIEAILSRHLKSLKDDIHTVLMGLEILEPKIDRLEHRFDAMISYVYESQTGEREE